jgi:hypothetical protein
MKRTPSPFVSTTIALSCLLLSGLAQATSQQRGIRQHLKFNTYTSESLVQILRPELDPQGARCEIKYLRPTVESSPIDGQGGIFCETQSGGSFFEWLTEDEVSHQGTRFEQIQFRFQGDLQKKLSLALRKAARDSQIPGSDWGWKNPRFTSGDLCSPDGSHCAESYYLNDSDDIRESGASFICARSTQKSAEERELPPLPAWITLGQAIDAAIEAGVLEVEEEYCVFTGV